MIVHRSGGECFSYLALYITFNVVLVIKIKCLIISGWWMIRLGCCMWLRSSSFEDNQLPPQMKIQSPFRLVDCFTTRNQVIRHTNEKRAASGPELG